METEIKPQPQIEFLDGCKHSVSACQTAVLNGTHVDEEGLLVCEHGYRRRGWRDVPKKACQTVGGDETEVVYRPDYSFSFDYLGIQREILGLSRA